MNMNSNDGDIKSIDKTVVHKVCSGQVILSLAIAVKELVENSIDAGATIIDIVVKEFGSEYIEVFDNGSGIKEANFKGVALKHHTSKIQDFNDLEKLGTLGFRGEALSSLCALSELEIVTKHSTSDVASKILYDQNGTIKSITNTARQTGTTATLRELFTPLPVRRKEFMKNLKREYSKMVQLLTAYCLVSKGIKFTCTNINSKGSRNIVLSTQGSSNYRDNIISIFGSKQIGSLIDVDILPPNESILSDFGISNFYEKPLPFKLEFLISSAMHGSGRSTSDRQFIFINCRPVDSSKVAKIVNETYREFNVNQYPFIFLNILSQDTLVDVNVTPDKRQIFIENEKFLLATIKMSLLESFKLFPSKIMNQTSLSSFVESKTLSNNQSEKRKSSGTDFLNGFRKKLKNEPEKPSAENFDNNPKMIDIKINNFSKEIKLKAHDINNCESKSLCETINNSNCSKKSSSEKSKTIDLKVDNFLKRINSSSNTAHDSCKLFSLETLNVEKLEDSINDESSKSPTNKPLKKSETEKSRNFTIIFDEQCSTQAARPEKFFNVTLDEVKKSLKNLGIKKEQSMNNIRFRSKISPENNKLAEAELQQLKHEDFKNMSVIGQFNLGFIITRLNNDLFIIDQHATDEIYNFEQLQENSTLDYQVLVNPMPLDVIPGYEALIAENEDIFKKNGFLFKFNMDAPTGKRVLLTAVPISHNTVFAKEDIHEMMSMLQESSKTMCRPSKVRAIFASKACRKSVMIGKALTEKDMKILVNHMGEIKKPWNCPHGRPTIRHLLNMNLLEEPDLENNEESEENMYID